MVLVPWTGSVRSVWAFWISAAEFGLGPLIRRKAGRVMTAKLVAAEAARTGRVQLGVTAPGLVDAGTTKAVGIETVPANLVGNMCQLDRPGMHRFGVWNSW